MHSNHLYFFHQQKCEKKYLFLQTATLRKAMQQINFEKSFVQKKKKLPLKLRIRFDIQSVMKEI